MASRRASAAAVIAQPVRCAIYCRKSTTEGLNSGFSSIDNQRQAAENYIASQAAQAWTCLPHRYDDFGYSGGTMDRPQMDVLRGDVVAGLVDVVVVVRLDRVSRDLADFVRFHKFLQEHGVALVSVAESINSATPHGKMMIGILATFGEYERSLACARTKDKICAARRRGRWTGGMRPLGYDIAPEGGKLVLNREEADQVRAIFDLYLEHQSLLSASAELARRGWRRKSWTTRDGKVRVGRPWNIVDLQRLLRDPLYVGRQKLGGETFKGEHQAIVSKATFDQVQRILDGNRRTSGASHRNRHGALLRGVLRCASCDASMTHAFTERRGKAFRYYRCTHAVKNGAAACPTGSVPALKIEELVVEQIKRIGTDPSLCEKTFRQVQAQVATERRQLKAEAKRVERELVSIRADVGRLTKTVTMATGAAADALMAKLAESQETVVAMEARYREVADRQQALDGRDVDPAAVGRALAQFTELWDVLLTPERERVIRLLIEQIDYRDGELTFTFSSVGARLLAAEIAS